MSAPARTCADCGRPLPARRRGRPRRYCGECVAARVAARQRAYRAANREREAARKRAYRAANREREAARQRAYRAAKRICSRCGERMRQPSASGLCGFCEAEAQ